MSKARWLGWPPLALALVCLCSAASSAHAGLLPHTGITRMCADADLIVEGTADAEGDGLTISRIHHAAGLEVAEGDRITVAGLSQHSRQLYSLFGQDGVPIQTRRAVLFLVQDESDPSRLIPIDSHAHGSRGLLWWGDEKCLGYAQVMNPGPYGLVEAAQSHGVADIAALRQAIERGLGLTRDWREIEAIESDVERAAAIAEAWRNKPEMRRLFSLRTEFREIGEPCMPALIGLLEDADEQTNLNEVVLTIYDIGWQQPEAAARATGLLIKRLKAPGPTARYYILSALTSGKDPKAIPSVREAVTNQAFDLQVRTQAAVALAAMGDVESFESIERVLDEVIAIPRKPRQNTGFGYAVDLLNALHQLDAERARAAIGRVGQTPGLSNAVSHIRNRP
ncbi:MAG: HEAT repeat domain-containing protein [Planctomycetota bacterium]